MSFRGEFNNSIDPKGRASIPAKFREILAEKYSGEHLVVTPKDGGLVAYPPSVWKMIEESVDAMQPGQRKEDIYLTLINPAADCTFDKQGRIQLPSALREYAGLNPDIREIVVAGVSNKIMIWNKAQHSEMRRQAEARLKADSQDLFALGF